MNRANGWSNQWMMNTSKFSIQMVQISLIKQYILFFTKFKIFPPGKLISADDRMENVLVYLKNESNSTSQHWKIVPL